MADTTSSDTTSEYPDDNLSDISAERQARFVVIGQQYTNNGINNGRNILKKLFTRELRGSLSHHNNFPEEKLFPKVPSWGHLPLIHVIPMSALQAGHIIMGLTQCGQFLLTYTCSMDLRVCGSLYKYLLHWWIFSPTKLARKVAEVTLFGSYTINKELDVIVAQWPMERNKIVIHGLHSDWGNSQTTDRAYLTITTLPSLSNCRECAKVAASYEEEELAANWDGCVRCNCLLHGLTVHTTYEVISPYPRFRASVCLNYQNHVVVNTGNFLHVLRVDLLVPKQRNSRYNERCDGDISEIEPLETSDIEEVDESKVDCCNSPCDKFYSVESCDASPIAEYTDDQKSCDCANVNECECGRNSNNINSTEQKIISVRDKILQDFCEDMNQELSIGSDSITLVKHPSCSPRPTPQRFPIDFRQNHIIMPPSDILRTRTESSHINPRKRPASPQPGTSQESINNINNVTSINSPLHTLSISPIPCAPRLMSPPIITTSFRHLSPRKRSNLHSPPPRTRATHKLILEAEKAYEFTDEAQETCEKLSSFRKRRLADKKYEFRVEAEDTENIIPFKHIRDQNEQRYCSLHHLNSRAVSPAYSGSKKHQYEESGEVEESNNQEVLYGCFKPVESEKTVLQPLSLNQRMFCRDRYVTVTHNDSPLAPRAFIPYPTIKCTNHFKRSYIELDDEMISVITDVEDDETGGYVSYQCVLPMHVHGSGYVQMQMISNGKVEKMGLPCVSINQFSFDIETFSHHIADWICKKFKKKYWHCSDYDIEIIDVCAITGDVICLLIMKIQASEYCKQPSCLQERKMYEAGCKYIWNIDTNQYKITHILPMTEKLWKNGSNESSTTSSPTLWNPTRYIAPLLRNRSKQPYVKTVRYIEHSMSFSTDSLVQILDMDNLVSLYMTSLPDETGPD